MGWLGFGQGKGGTEQQKPARSVSRDEVWTRDVDLAWKIRAQEARRSSFVTTLFLAYSSLGVIYGDIGVSIIFVFAQIFSPVSLADETGEALQTSIYGALSLIFWTLTLIALVKYVLVVLVANDTGEGGTIALYAQLCRAMGFSPFGTMRMKDHRQMQAMASAANPSTRRGREGRDSRDGSARRTKSANGRRRMLSQPPLIRPYEAPLGLGVLERYYPTRWFRTHVGGQRVLLLMTMLATGLVLGDGILMPAFSVNSAIAGIEAFLPGALSNGGIVGISITIIVLLFLIQHYGTQALSFLFSPIITLWLAANLTIAIYNLHVYGTGVFNALNPAWIVRFFHKFGTTGWEMLGGVMLCVSGTETMFAAMGHFSQPAVALSFGLFVYPCLVLAYLGQGAYLLEHPHHVPNAFWASTPAPVKWPMLVLATLAAVVASQAVITGAFSLARQAMVLGVFPHLKTIHTNSFVEGQIFIPIINYSLMVLCVAVVAGFKGDQVQLGNAYGVAVMTVMLLTTFMVTLVMVIQWELSLVFVCLFAGFYVIVDGTFLSATLIKVPSGGWVALVIAAVVMTIMLVWWGGSYSRRRAVVRANKTNTAQNMFRRVDPSKISTPLLSVPTPGGDPAPPNKWAGTGGDSRRILYFGNSVHGGAAGASGRHIDATHHSFGGSSVLGGDLTFHGGKIGSAVDLTLMPLNAAGYAAADASISHAYNKSVMARGRRQFNELKTRLAAGTQAEMAQQQQEGQDQQHPHQHQEHPRGGGTGLGGGAAVNQTAVRQSPPAPDSLTRDVHAYLSTYGARAPPSLVGIGMGMMPAVYRRSDSPGAEIVMRTDSVGSPERIRRMLSSSPPSGDGSLRSMLSGIRGAVPLPQTALQMAFVRLASHHGMTLGEAVTAVRASTVVAPDAGAAGAAGAPRLLAARDGMTLNEVVEGVRAKSVVGAMGAGVAGAGPPIMLVSHDGMTLGEVATAMRTSVAAVTGAAPAVAGAAAAGAPGAAGAARGRPAVAGDAAAGAPGAPGAPAAADPARGRPAALPIPALPTRGAPSPLSHAAPAASTATSAPRPTPPARSSSGIGSGSSAHAAGAGVGTSAAASATSAAVVGTSSLLATGTSPRGMSGDGCASTSSGGGGGGGDGGGGVSPRAKSVEWWSSAGGQAAQVARLSVTSTASGSRSSRGSDALGGASTSGSSSDGDDDDDSDDGEDSDCSGSSGHRSRGHALRLGRAVLGAVGVSGSCSGSGTSALGHRARVSGGGGGSGGGPSGSPHRSSHSHGSSPLPLPPPPPGSPLRGLAHAVTSAIASPLRLASPRDVTRGRRERSRNRSRSRSHTRHPPRPHAHPCEEAGDPLARLSGLGMFYADSPMGVPPVMTQFLRNIDAMHDVVIIVTVRFLPMPSVKNTEKLLVVARYGYTDVVDHSYLFVSRVISTIMHKLELKSGLKYQGLEDDYINELEGDEEICEGDEEEEEQREASVHDAFPPKSPVLPPQRGLRGRLGHDCVVPRAAIRHHDCSMGLRWGMGGNAYEPNRLETVHESVLDEDRARMSRAGSAEPEEFSPWISSFSRNALERIRLAAQASDVPQATRDALEAAQVLVDAARERVVYYLGRSITRAHSETGSMWTRLSVSGMYQALERIAYRDSEAWRIPVEHLVELGMRVEI
ncbi:hypothetical protein FOA52_008672 [Chlamydomonas sp. UWO 241]|nr:hypothetical protein FOA52_008672 [Chlamydomonas sp. UWO 241]